MDFGNLLSTMYPDAALDETTRGRAWVGRNAPTHYLLRALRHSWFVGTRTRPRVLVAVMPIQQSPPQRREFQRSPLSLSLYLSLALALSLSLSLLLSLAP